MHRLKIADTSIGLADGLKTEVAESIIELLDSGKVAAQPSLEGRAEIVHSELPGVGQVVVKRYARGGLLRHLVQQRYLRLGATRSEQEFLALDRAAALGVSVPVPVACVSRGKIFYEAWLVMREIPGHRTLAEISREDENRGADFMAAVVSGVRKLVEHRLWHIDLHPGNIIVDGADHVVFLDFDRARTFRGGTVELRDRYVCRWRRAVIKHGLPEVLSELFSSGLRRSFDAAKTQAAAEGG